MQMMPYIRTLHCTFRRCRGLGLLLVKSCYSCTYVFGWWQWHNAKIKKMIWELACEVSDTCKIFLTICSPHRKCVQKGLLHFSIWTAYLLADWAANFCVGHIASNQVSGSKTGINSTHSHLLAFWAPFLLVHLGGPDTITAFSLEDNQLWRRHMLGFIIQFTTCAYVFLLTVPGNRLWIPTVLVFVVGMIKYGEKIYALYRAREYDNKYRDCYWSLPTDNYPSKESSLSKLTLEQLEFKLNFYYEACFTKFPLLRLKRGCILRFVAISCVLIAFGLFFNEDKHKEGLGDFDVKVTYTLLCGAIALDTVALLMLPFSPFSPIRIQRFLELKRPKWRKCRKKPFTKYTELSTWFPLRRWNGSIPGFNMISYCHSMMTTKYYKCMVPSHYRCSTIFMWMHVVKNPFLFELWDFISNDIVNELRTAGEYRGIIDDVTKDDYWWILENLSGGEENREKLISFLDDKKIIGGFDSSVIVWHIATCLCYIKEKDEYQVDEREFGKLLSDYMLYLFIVDSNMISAIGRDGQQKNNGSTLLESFRETLLKIMPFFNNDEDEAKACMNLLASKQSPNSLINRGCELSKELEQMIPIKRIKWKIISQVWFVMLSRVAFDCSPSFHFQHLSEGGEFISFLMMLKFEIDERL
ncbi:hypothetical protein RIF29_31628 [Crotalaria pallida]|uniref:DUF4220 domain-containing protein n=1 Tax=Crotalaria pallida TaxID=3830 RepID=A0AAN9EI50_CROPI